jgi:hypothetical protein
MNQQEVNEGLIKAIQKLNQISLKIRDNPETKISEDELKGFILITSSAVMALHLLITGEAFTQGKN